MAEVCTCMTYNCKYTPDFGTCGTYQVALDSVMGQIIFVKPEDGKASVDFVDLGPPIPGVEI